MQDECRILLLHGLLHLLGHDHELGDEESESMAQQEQKVMHSLGWKVHYSAHANFCSPESQYQAYLAPHTGKTDITLNDESLSKE